jgi:hypothetical protein
MLAHFRSGAINITETRRLWIQDVAILVARLHTSHAVSHYFSLLKQVFLDGRLLSATFGRWRPVMHK